MVQGKVLLSVVVPVKDEPSLFSFLHDLHSALLELVGRDNYEILIQQEEGLGAALASGMKKSKGEWILTIDADGQHDPRDIAKLWKLRDQAHIVIGGKSRHNDSRSLFKKLAAKAYYHYVRPKNYDIQDLGSNFRLYNRSILSALDQKYPKGFKFLQWILLEAARMNAEICEIPVSFNPRLAGKSKMSYRHELMERLRKS